MRIRCFEKLVGAFTRSTFALAASALVVVAFFGLIPVALPDARAVDITVTSTLAGTTPDIVGYNSGHFMPGSNTADWWRYSGVNGARVWATPSVVETGDDRAPWGDGVASEPGFLARRDALRASPISRSYNYWPEFEGNYKNNPTTGSNIINLEHAFSSMHSLGIDPLVNIHRSTSYAWDDPDPAIAWANRWEHWQHFYAQAFYLARHFDVHRFQMYNEPNLDENLTLAEYRERLRFASDAVQSAVADVNRIYGKSLDAQVQGPVTAGAASLFSSWGAPVMADMHNTIDPAFPLIQTYAYQQYNATGDTFAGQLASIKNSVTAAANGQPMRFAITEFNTNTASAFENTTETLDSPSKSSRLGSILASLANQQPDELYVFKFSQGPGEGASGVKKNGTHFVDNNSSPYNIGGVTNGGEVVRLFAKGFAGANELFNVPATAGTGAGDIDLAASYNAAKNRYYLFAANEATGERDLSINIGQWGVQEGAYVAVEEVSATSHGELRHLIRVGANGMLNVTQPAQSVLLFSIPKVAPVTQVTLNASQDALVKAGLSGNSNFGASPDLFAANDRVDPTARTVSFIKFNTGSIVTSKIDQAILQVFGENRGSGSQVIAHVYGLTSDAWDEATITWNNAPNLADSNGTAVDDISENFIEGIGTSASFVGHFTGISTAEQMAIDVTNFVRDHPDQELTFMIAREVRFDGENVDDALAALHVGSSEATTGPGPQLVLSLSALPIAGDFDANGVVDQADFAVWRKNYGNIGINSADFNGNGLVDAGDYVAWRKSFGPTSPATGAGSQSAPEPATAVLLAAILPLFSLRNRR